VDITPIFLFPDLCDENIRETPGCVESDTVEGEAMCYSAQEQYACFKIF
jgi:hypothetical protein